MLAYSIIMFAISIVLISVSKAIHKGKTELIHSYHQTKVKDKAAYGKAFGKALFIVALAPLFSGTVSLFGDSVIIAVIAVALLLVVLCIGIGCIAAVQKRYNNGVF